MHGIAGNLDQISTVHDSMAIIVPHGNGWWSKLEDLNLCIRVDPIHLLTRQISTVLWVNRTSQMMPCVMLTFEVWPAIGSWSKGCEEHMHEAYDGPQSTRLWIYFSINRASFLCFKHLSTTLFFSNSLHLLVILISRCVFNILYNYFH